MESLLTFWYIVVGVYKYQGTTCPLKCAMPAYAGIWANSVLMQLADVESVRSS